MMPAGRTAQRREFRRLTLPLSARFRLRGSPAVRQGTIENISGAGATLLTPIPLPRDAIVEQLRFSLPAEGTRDRVKICVAAGVIASEQRSFSDSSERYRSGLVFLNLAGEPFEEVCEIIERELGEEPAAAP